MMYGGGAYLPKARTSIESPGAEDYWNFTCAKHLRGRTRAVGRRTGAGYARYMWEVVNTHTGEVVVESDAFGLEDAIAAATVATQIARGAYFWSIRFKTLR